MADRDQDTQTSELDLLIVETTGTVLASMASAGQINPDNVQEVTSRIGGALRGVIGFGGAPVVQAEPEQPKEPAVPIKKSITPDYIVCLEDGKHLKSLKRYLRTRFDLTPEQYRQKWGLPKDYPMVAPNYAKARSDLAKSMGLGRKPGQTIGNKDRAPNAAAPARGRRAKASGEPAAASA